MAVSDNLKGALFMTAAMLTFLVNDSLMKASSDEVPLMQAIAVRGVGTTLLLAVVCLALGGVRLRMPRRDAWKVAARTVAEAASAGLYIAALFHLPLANATAILQALPLTVTLAGALFLREPVGWRRLSAILLGFVGVLLIVRPGLDGFNHYALLAILSVGAVTVRDVVTRSLGPAVPSLTVALAAAVGVMLFGFAGTAGTPWVPLGLKAGLQLSGAAGAIILGYLFSIRAMRVGEIGAVTPFRYTSLLFVLVSGLVVFGDWPDPLTLLGAGIVVATGLFTLYRERRRGRADPVPLRVR